MKWSDNGKKATISHYDLYKDNHNGEILIFKKGGGGEAIPTGYYIE
ncbi:polymorphic toxin type 33 domain-containing protein [Bacteroides faecichinchillae]